GAFKLYITHTVLQQRKLHPDLFLRGDYEGLAAPDNVVAFTRSYGSERLIVAAPRLSHLLTRGEQPFPLREAWRDGKLRLPYAGRYRNVLTDTVLGARGNLRLADVFADLPVALLWRENEG
ncbi:MAG TPA: hypothetical protein VFX59_15025, partial [Polyangiales bacterium]|nr:hypothetical protein [Polyangiales bacterium]